MEEVKRLLRIFKNKLLLRLGFVMANKQGFTVYLKDGIQVCSNARRRGKPYSMDDKGWTTLNKHVKQRRKQHAILRK